MPLLARETDLFPDDLLDPAALMFVAERDWEVVHTLPRREKDLARRLLALEIPFYLPQVEQRTRSPGGRRRVSYLPLFPGYLFLNAADDQRGQVIDTGCVARLLSVPDPEELIFDLRQIHELTRSGEPFLREPKFECGARVRVVAGPFQGFEGQVLKHHSGDRLLVQIHYLRQGVSISLEGCVLEAA